MRRFTLIELVVSLGLVAALLGLLMHFLRTTTIVANQLERELESELSRSYLQMQLDPLFFELVYEEDGGLFFTNEESNELSFFYFHGIDSQPLFCGELSAHLAIEDGELRLTRRPSNRQWGEMDEPIDTALLAKNASDLQFRFFIPERPENLLIFLARGGKERPEPLRERPVGWFLRWRKEYGGLPAMCEISLKIDGEPVRYLFSPLHSHEPIIYYES